MKKNRKGQTAPFFLCLVLIFILSCGDRNLKIALRRFQQESNMSLSIESKCDPKTQTVYEKHINKIDELYTRNYNQLMRVQKNSLTQIIGALSLPSYSPQSPLIFSRKSIENKLNEIEEILVRRKTHSDYAIDYNVESKLFELRTQVLRLKFNDCRKGELKIKKLMDPRSFLFLQDYCNTYECFKRSFQSPLEKNILKSKYLEMCQQVNTKDQCVLSMESYGAKNKLQDLLIATKSTYLVEKYARFYSLTKEGQKNKFRCQKSYSKNIISIKVKFQGISSVDEGKILDWIKLKWNNELLEFEFEKVDAPLSPMDSRPLIINWVTGGTSYLEWDKPNVINLSNSISEEQLSLVAPHEFGHYLGFPDCYVEFMNEKNEYIYYELPSNKNIMCSLNLTHVVPEFYREIILQQLCIH